MRPLRAAAVIVAVATLLATTHLGAQAIHRSLFVSVVDEAGTPVPDLGPTDFVVREDNVAREVLTVEPAVEPLQVAVLIDNSQAATTYIQDLRRGLERFIAAMTEPTASGAHHQLALIGIADRPTILTDYTTNKADLLKGLGRVFAQPASGMTLIDAVFETSRGLQKRSAGRPVIVSIATEGREFSSRMHTDAVDALKQADARYIVVTLGRPFPSLETEMRERALLLADGTTQTGGWRENLLTGLALPQALEKLAAELTHEYRVTYAHPDTLIPPEKIMVTMKRSGLVARGRPGKQEGGRP